MFAVVWVVVVLCFGVVGVGVCFVVGCGVFLFVVGVCVAGVGWWVCCWCVRGVGGFRVV